VIRLFKLLLLLIALPSGALAQAWLSPQGEGTVGLFYQYSFDRLHSYSDGRTKDRGHTFFDSLLLDTDISLTNNLAVRVSVPYVMGTYIGGAPHQTIRGNSGTNVTIDDGAYHGALQDYRFDVRYSVSRRELKVEPFVEGILPSHSYATFGHAAVGMDLREFRMGLNVGRRLNPILPKAFFQARYAFGFSQEVANVAPKRSYAEMQVGYLLTRKVSLQFAATSIFSHNGIQDDYNLFPGNLTQLEWLNHDRISKMKLIDLGATVGYSFNRSTNIVVGAGHTVWGENTHLRTMVITIGFVKAFSTPLAGDRPSKTAFLPEGNRPLVCTCAKSK
jgi:hypothetical protein